MQSNNWKMIGVVTVAAFVTALNATTASAEIVFGTSWVSGNHHASDGSPSLPGEQPQLRFEVTKEADDSVFGTLVSDTVSIQGSYHASMKKGYIAGVDIGHVFRGSNVKNLNTIELLPQGWKSLHETFTYDVKTTSLPSNIQQGIIASCNGANMSNGQSFFDFPIHMQVTARRFRRGNTRLNPKADKRFDGVIRAKVFCTSFSHNALPTKPLDINLNVKSLDSDCLQNTEVRTKIYFDKPQTAVFRFRHNGKLSEAIEIKARKVKRNGRVLHLIERVKNYKLQPGNHRFRVEVRNGRKSDVVVHKVKCAPFSPTAMWLTLDQQNKATCPKKVKATVRITANRVGSVLTKIKNQAGVTMAIEPIAVKRKGDQFTGVLKQTFDMSEIDTMLIAESANDANLNSGWQPLKVTCLEPLKGTLSFHDPEQNDCPRKAKVAMAIRTTISGNVRYNLRCSNGFRWSGKLNARQTDPATYLAVGVKSFKVKKNGHINCALRSIVDGKSQVLTMQGHDFQCVRQNPDAGPSTVGTPTRPTHDDSKPVPPRIVTPVPPRTPPSIIVDCGRGFKKVGKRCVRISCPRGETLVRNRCIRRIVECKRGFKKVGKRCVGISCPSGQKRVGNRCVRRIVECKRGFKKVGKRCVQAEVVCPRGYLKMRGRCTKPAARGVNAR